MLEGIMIFVSLWTVLSIALGFLLAKLIKELTF